MSALYCLLRRKTNRFKFEAVLFALAKFEMSDNCLRGNIKKAFGDFPGGAVVGNPPAYAGDTGSSPGPGRSHIPRNN